MTEQPEPECLDERMRGTYMTIREECSTTDGTVVYESEPVALTGDPSQIQMPTPRGVTGYDDLMPDGWPRYSLFAPGTITYHGGGRWSKPTTGSNGSAMFSSEHDCNPICGCHLASKCGTCNVCTNCDGCYCGEWE